jgi:Flp pilus assembly protein TadD
MCRKLALAATAVLMLAPAPAAFAADKTAAAPAAKAPAVKPVKKATKQERDMADRTDPATRADFWAAQVALDPNDAEAGLKLALALRTLGQWDKAADTAQDVTIRHPDNEDAYLDFGRAALGGESERLAAPVASGCGL